MSYSTKVQKKYKNTKKNIGFVFSYKFCNFVDKRGYVLVTALFVLVILSLLGIIFISFMVNEKKISANSKNAVRAFYIAQAGVEKAIFELNQPGSTYTGETNTAFGGGYFTVAAEQSEQNPNTKVVTSTGYYPVGQIFPAKRRIELSITAHPSGSGMAVLYAIQVGNEGLYMYSNSQVNGSVWSNGNITGYSNTRINGDAYAVGTISSPNPVVSGTRYPGSPAQQLPYIDIEYWKTQANINNDPYNGNLEYNGNDSFQLGPRRINGSLSLNQNVQVTLNGPLYVTGNFAMNSNTQLFLNESFGSSGTVIIVDGTVNIASNAIIHPTNTNPKGYIMVVGTNTGIPCMELNSNTAGGIFYAYYGGIQINSNAHATAVLGKRLILNSNATLDYDTGLASSYFSAGPGGAWLPDAKSWKEIY